MAEITIITSQSKNIAVYSTIELQSKNCNPVKSGILPYIDLFMNTIEH